MSSAPSGQSLQPVRHGKEDPRHMVDCGSLIAISGGMGSVANHQMPAPLRPGGVPELRLLDRGAAFGQSTGRIHVSRMMRREMVRKLRWGDLFHTVVHHSTFKIIMLAFFSYSLAHTVFSLVYWVISDRCYFEIESWLDAFFLSVQVGMTIGWGLPGHPYLKKNLNQTHGCYSGAMAILLHTLVMHILNALLIGILYARISRGTKRSSSIAFTDRAVIREIKGKLYFMFQTCELRKHQLTEAHVRCYALCAPAIGDGGDAGLSEGPTQIMQHPMRLLQPNDELGGTLLMALPSLVIHEIDAWSPFAQKAGCCEDFPSLARRAVDIGPQGLPNGEKSRSHPTRQDVESFLSNNWIEVVCLVEGFEPTTSSTIQARHSYANEDLVFDHGFAPCVSRHRSKDSSWVIDFDRFHSLVPMPSIQEDEGSDVTLTGLGSASGSRSF